MIKLILVMLLGWIGFTLFKKFINPTESNKVSSDSGQKMVACSHFVIHIYLNRKRLQKMVKHTVPKSIRSKLIMKFLFDFGPIILFFVVYKLYGLYTAIYAMIAATFVQMIYSRYTTGKFVNSQVLTFALLVVFGGISIALRDPCICHVEGKCLCM